MFSGSWANNAGQTCRTCLSRDAELISLEGLRNNTTEGSVPFQQFLWWTRLKDEPELPKKICVNCSSILKLAAEFIDSAILAHSILYKQLCAYKRPPIAIKQEPTVTRNGSYPNSSRNYYRDSTTNPYRRDLAAKQFRCKECNVKLENKDAMREHRKLHLADTKLHSCNLCVFKTRHRHELKSHYDSTHKRINLDQCRQRALVNVNRSGPLDALQQSSVVCPIMSLESQAETTGEAFDLEMLIPSTSIQKPTVCEFDQNLQEFPSQIQLATVLNDDSNVLAAMPNIHVDGNILVGEYMMTNNGSYVHIPTDNGTEFNYVTAEHETTEAVQENDMEELDIDGFVPESLIVDERVLASNQMLSDRRIENGSSVVAIEDINGLVQRKSDDSIDQLYRNVNFCKLCGKEFAALASLFKHVFSHKDVDKYFCQWCSFYTQHQAELAQHYRTRHNIAPAEDQLLPKGNNEDSDNKYVCENCDFDAKSCANLKNHYKSVHLCKNENDATRTIIQSMECANCQLHFGSSELYQKHLMAHLAANQQSSENAEPNEGKIQSGVEPYASTSETMLRDNQIVIPSSLANDIQSKALGLSLDVSGMSSNMTPVMQHATNDLFANTFSLFSLRSGDPENNNYNLNASNNNNTPSYNVNVLGETFNVPASHVEDSSRVVNIGQTFIDDSDVAAVYTIPADGIQTTTANDLITSGDNTHLLGSIFDFGDEEYMDDEADDNNRTATDKNVIYTSDEEDIDDSDDETPKENLQKPYCKLCKMPFTSQYQFENHVFLHRELVPYRCEQCTNVYVKKADLKRHYQTVHKQTPSRDMVQPKGDKSLTDESSYIAGLRMATTLMCCKCPFECTERKAIMEHITKSHKSSDQDFIVEDYIICKLPFECSRCIRSFATPTRLLKHLQRSHLITNGIEAIIANTNENAETPTSAAQIFAATASSSVPSLLMSNIATTGSVVTNFNCNTSSESTQNCGNGMATLLGDSYQ